MSQIQQATKGTFGILKQTAFNTPQTIDDNFKYFAFTDCDFGPLEQQGVLPPEAGNRALTGGGFKLGVHAQGGVSLVPRLENRFGYFLEAVCGDASSYADQTIAQVIAGSGSEVGVNTHLFGFADGDEFSLPYLTVHRLLPHDTSTSEVGEIFQDVRVMSFRLNVLAAQLVTARMDMLGRCSTATVWDIEPGWHLPLYDADTAFLVTGCTGSVKISVSGGTPATLSSFDATNASLTWINMLLPPARSRVIGSAHPMDYPVLSRAIGIDCMLYIDDYDLYVQTFGGAASPVTDTGWSCTPLEGDVDVTLLSPDLIGATTEYHQLRYQTDQANVEWYSRPINLVANQPVILQLRGIVTRVSAGRPFNIYIQNDHADYS